LASNYLSASILADFSQQIATAVMVIITATMVAITAIEIAIAAT
jgi:hypothetical protein